MKFRFSLRPEKEPATLADLGARVQRAQATIPFVLDGQVLAENLTTCGKDAAWLEAHPQYKAYSWDFHFDETKHQDGFYYHFTQCPLNTFARKEGYLEVLPIMCDIDYKTAALMHAKLYRDHTLAGSGEVCDYWFVGDKVENPK